MRILIEAILFLLISGSLSAQTAAAVGAGAEPGSKGGIDYFSAPNLLKFADHLYQQKDYERAAAEYMRFLIAYPDSPRTRACHSLIRCYEKSRQFERALKATQFLPDSLLMTDCFWQRRKAKLLFRTDQFSKLNTWLDSNLACVNDSMQALLGFVHLRQRRWQPARAHFALIDSSNSLRPRFLELSLRAEHLARKSPHAAGLLSAALPGSGKLYLGHNADALLSFVTTGVTAWASYSAFDRDGAKSTAGWIYGGLASFFYFGNVYGSYVGAKIYNRNQLQKTDLRIEAEINLFLD